MRYNLVDGKPVEVISIVVDGMRIVHPTDEQVDDAGAGYALRLVNPPEYDPETGKLLLSYALEGGEIVQVWTVEELPQPSETERRIAEINQLLAASNAGFVTFKETPIEYPANGLKYKPSYLTDYWVPILPLGAAAFPMVISDADCVPQEMTFEEFTNLYTWLLTVSAQEIATVNAYQKPLIAELEELENGQN